MSDTMPSVSLEGVPGGVEGDTVDCEWTVSAKTRMTKLLIDHDFVGQPTPFDMLRASIQST